MSNNKSHGFYSCSVSILKHASDITSDVLTKIFNKSIDLGTFPSKLKMQRLYQFLNLMITRILITTDQYLYYHALTEFLKNLFIRE